MSTSSKTDSFKFESKATEALGLLGNYPKCGTCPLVPHNVDFVEMRQTLYVGSPSKIVILAPPKE